MAEGDVAARQCLKGDGIRDRANVVAENSYSVARTKGDLEPAQVSESPQGYGDLPSPSLAGVLDGERAEVEMCGRVVPLSQEPDAPATWGGSGRVCTAMASGRTRIKKPTLLFSVAV